jgi:hypothetical protein
MNSPKTKEKYYNIPNREALTFTAFQKDILYIQNDVHQQVVNKISEKSAAFMFHCPNLDHFKTEYPVPFETSDNRYQTTRHHIAEHRRIQNKQTFKLDT